ncbi:MAG: hypothetical protein KDD70_06515 [Bdellovibrionales bacterium]|nr:hypothetical protein [Bdellovibrionales bacterium]
MNTIKFVLILTVFSLSQTVAALACDCVQSAPSASCPNGYTWALQSSTCAWKCDYSGCKGDSRWKCTNANGDTSGSQVSGGCLVRQCKTGALSHDCSDMTMGDFEDDYSKTDSPNSGRETF